MKPGYSCIRRLRTIWLIAALVFFGADLVTAIDSTLTHLLGLNFPRAEGSTSSLPSSLAKKKPLKKKPGTPKAKSGVKQGKSQGSKLNNKKISNKAAEKIKSKASQKTAQKSGSSTTKVSKANPKEPVKQSSAPATPAQKNEAPLLARDEKAKNPQNSVASTQKQTQKPDPKLNQKQNQSKNRVPASDEEAFAMLTAKRRVALPSPHRIFINPTMSVYRVDSTALDSDSGFTVLSNLNFGATAGYSYARKSGISYGVLAQFATASAAALVAGRTVQNTIGYLGGLEVAPSYAPFSWINLSLPVGLTRKPILRALDSQTIGLEPSVSTRFGARMAIGTLLFNRYAGSFTTGYSYLLPSKTDDYEISGLGTRLTATLSIGRTFGRTTVQLNSGFAFEKQTLKALSLNACAETNMGMGFSWHVGGK